MNRLIYDIETSPNIVLSFQIGREVSLNHGSIIKERAIMTIAWKWENDDETHVIHWDRNQCDKKMLSKFLKELAKADECVAHWGDRYDYPWLRARALFHGLDFPPCKTVDTCKWASKLAVNSRKLDYLGKFLGLGEKLHTDFGLWKAIVMDKCPVAMAKMCAYNRQDVLLLEAVYQKLAPIMIPKTHVGVLNGGTKWSCPHCATESVHKNKTRVTAAGTIQHQMKCSAGHTYSINDRSFSDYSEAKRK